MTSRAAHLERQRTIAKYLQRYALKNDTSLLRPVRDSLDPALAASRRAGLVAAREVHFEDWAVEALAEQLAYSPALLGICTVRKKPFAWIEGDELHRPPTPPQPLDAPARALLELAADAPTVDVLVARAGGSRDELLATLAALRRTGLVVCAVELPAEIAHKERHLRALLDATAPSDARTEALAQLVSSR